MANLRFMVLCALLSVLFASSGAAEDTPGENSLSVELNTVADNGDGCTLTFVVANRYSNSIEQLVFEVVLFDKSGAVDRLTLFNFGQLPVGSQRVRQFAVNEISCEGVGRILFNGVHTCQAEGVPPASCEAGLQFSTRSHIEVLG